MERTLHNAVPHLAGQQKLATHPNSPREGGEGEGILEGCCNGYKHSSARSSVPH